MSDERKCPKCGADDLILVNVTEDGADWGLDPDEYDEDAEVWVCQNYVGVRLCGWSEEATEEEAMDEHMRQIEWLGERLAQIREAKP